MTEKPFVHVLHSARGADGSDSDSVLFGGEELNVEMENDGRQELETPSHFPFGRKSEAPAWWRRGATGAQVNAHTWKYT